MNSHIFVAEYGDYVNSKIVCAFSNKDIGIWVMELLNDKMHFKNRSYNSKGWYDCFTVGYREYGQTLFKFCFDDVKNLDELNLEIDKTCRWQQSCYVFPKLFNEKIKKIILLQNKIRKEI